MKECMEKAVQLVGQVYSDFFCQIIEAYVLDEREGNLPEPALKRLADKTHIDTRVIRMMAVSGKGGWSEDAEKWARYAKNFNVTLLDHVLSVVRGSMLFYALNRLARNPNMDEAILKRRLRVIAVIGFLHDLDKLLSLVRGTQLPLAEVKAAVERYGIVDFLKAVNVSLNAEQLRYLIEKAEASQAYRTPPQQLPPRELESLADFVALADKLDGIWFSSDPEKGRLKGVLDYLSRNETIEYGWLRHWKSLELFDPHHPFLLDELQRWLSVYSLRLTGMPPLIEVHQDGELFMLLPEAGFDDIVDKAIKGLCKRLPFELELNISNRGVPELREGQPDYLAMCNFIAGLPDRKLGQLFRFKASLQEIAGQALDTWVGVLGLSPRWPKVSGETITPYPAPSRLESDGKQSLHRVAMLVLLLNLKLPADKKTGLPDYDQRERSLLDKAREVGQERPDWLNQIKGTSFDQSRRTLTAFWIFSLVQAHPILDDDIWGEEGLLQYWLEGKDQALGFNRYLQGRGPAIARALEKHLEQLLKAEPVTAGDEDDLGRCLFTDQPVPFDDIIDQALGLYQVKVSAFSGREGRPESLTSESAHTNIGPVSIAEHKLRAQTHLQQSSQADGVPTLISSPSTAGLFGGLGITHDKALGTMSVYDLSRQEVKKGTVYHGLEIYRGRYRLARFERIPEKTAEQVNQLRLLLQACRRIGRPLHLFRGLPSAQRAFFFYDAMPRVLMDLVGGNSLRLEQLPDAIKQLEITQALLETPGLGYDTLKLYACEATRFEAVCLIWCQLHQRWKQALLKEKNGLKQKMDAFLNIYLGQEEKQMTTSNSPLVRLGRAAAKIQRKPPSNASNSEEMLAFKLCMDFAVDACALKQTDDESLINGITDVLETNLVRRMKAASREHRNGKSLREGCLEVASLFVNEVWKGVLQQRPPAQKTRRILGSIYRMSFLLAARNFSEDSADAELESELLEV